MKNKIQLLCWWLAWVFLLTATVFIRVEHTASDVHRPVNSTGFLIAAIISLGGYMLVDITKSIKRKRPWVSGFQNYKYASLKRKTYNDLKEFAQDEEAVTAIRQRFLVRSEDAGVETTMASDEFADLLTSARGR